MTGLQPVRLHIECDGSAASIWIGTDRDMTAHLPQLVASVTDALTRSGVRLRSVVCNGRRHRSVDEAATGRRHAAGTGPGGAVKLLDITIESET